MKIYIASSWKHKHGVEMLTEHLRQQGNEVVSWIENCSIEGDPNFDFEEWVNTPEAEECFKFDIDGATTCDLFIYYGASGMDACCEMGAAWSKGIEIVALYGKGESLGLMRKMVSVWYNDYRAVLNHVEKATKDHAKSMLPKLPAEKTANTFVYLDFDVTKKVASGNFFCKQCAIKQVMNANCIYALNQIQESVQCCSNCGYDNLFNISSLINAV